MFSLDLTFS